MWQGLEGLGWGWITVAAVHIVLFWVLCIAVLWLLMTRGPAASKEEGTLRRHQDGRGP